MKIQGVAVLLILVCASPQTWGSCLTRMQGLYEDRELSLTETLQAHRLYTGNYRINSANIITMMNGLRGHSAEFEYFLKEAGGETLAAVGFLAEEDFKNGEQILSLTLTKNIYFTQAVWELALSEGYRISKKSQLTYTAEELPYVEQALKK